MASSKGCQECQCERGEIICHQKLCVPVTCSHPSTNELNGCCPTCFDCTFCDENVPDGVGFPNPKVEEDLFCLRVDNNRKIGIEKCWPSSPPLFG